MMRGHLLQIITPQQGRGDTIAYIYMYISDATMACFLQCTVLPGGKHDRRRSSWCTLSDDERGNNYNSCYGIALRFSVETFSPRPPFQVIWRWFSLTWFLSVDDRPPFFPPFLAFLVGFVASPLRGVGVGFEGPHLRHMF